MTTDVEESDTDDLEKPGPAKRKRVVNHPVNNLVENNQSAREPSNLVEVMNEEEEDRLQQEKLRRWQACQVAKGFIDNTINRVVETCLVSPYDTDPFEDEEMEDTAVTMAICNHGLVCSPNFNQSPSFFKGKLSNFTQSSISGRTSVATKSSERILLGDSDFASTSGDGNHLDDTYDSDHQQDFLDRAVAEAIKKKGLSTLSVEYG